MFYGNQYTPKLISKSNNYEDILIGYNIYIYIYIYIYI